MVLQFNKLDIQTFKSLKVHMLRFRSCIYTGQLVAHLKYYLIIYITTSELRISHLARVGALFVINTYLLQLKLHSQANQLQLTLLYCHE